MVTPTTMLLAETVHAKRLGRAEQGYLVAAALVGAPARRRWLFAFRFHRPAPRPSGLDRRLNALPGVVNHA